MSKKTKPAKSLPQSTDYFSDLKKWPDDWKVTDKDLKIGMEMLEPFSAFIKFLLAMALQKKLLKIIYKILIYWDLKLSDV